MTTTEQELLRLSNCITMFAELSEKTASAEGSTFIQEIGAVSADVLYSVMVKEALSRGYAGPKHRQVVAFIKKIAQENGKPLPTLTHQRKIAGIVVADDAISNVLRPEMGVKTASDYSKLFGMRSMGREFFVEMLQKVF